MGVRKEEKGMDAYQDLFYKFLENVKKDNVLRDLYRDSKIVNINNDFAAQFTCYVRRHEEKVFHLNITIGKELDYFVVFGDVFVQIIDG